jgi:hypothetical protein
VRQPSSQSDKYLWSLHLRSHWKGGISLKGRENNFLAKKAFQGVKNLKGFFILFIPAKQVALRGRERYAKI